MVCHLSNVWPKSEKVDFSNLEFALVFLLPPTKYFLEMILMFRFAPIQYEVEKQDLF
jgi:hypothetical protein